MAKDLTGSRFGKLEVLSTTSDLSVAGSYKHALWFCKCDCGNTKYIPHTTLVSRKVQSCGCLSKRHGMCDTRPYNIWMAMKCRCNGTGGERSKYYHGKGITYDPRWEDFNNFWEDVGADYCDDLELERIDVAGNYCKSNCTWVSHGQQVINRGVQVNNTSSRTGVRKPKDNDKWVATIQIRGVAIHLGSFSDFNEAVKAREAAELKYFGFIKKG